MNRALPEMLHCLNIPNNNGGDSAGTDMSVLERQAARRKWQQEQIEVQQQRQQQEQSFFTGNELTMFSIPQQFQGLLGNGNDQSLVEFMSRSMVKADPGMENAGWPDFGGGDGQLSNYNGGYGNASGIEMNYAISRTGSCPPAVAAAMADSTKGCHHPISQGNLSSGVGRESFKKRKADKTQSLKVVTEEEETKEKRIKGCAEEGDSKITQQNSNNKNNTTNNDNNNNSGETSEKSKISEVQKPDYIHVRARRGQATDSHSLAERVRREKISERMKYLQDLVPGCNKITGKAGMLDEIINYVQSLQRQVEFLSMKLAAVNPRLDFNIENFFTKEMFPASTTTSFPTIGSSSEMANPAYVQLNQLHQQVVSYCGLETGINPTEMALRRTISAPVSIPDQTFIDSSCFNQIQPSSTWDPELQSLYGMEFQQSRLTAFQSQQFTGSTEGGNLKMEM